MIEFFQVNLTIKEEQDDSVAQAVHRRSGQSAAQWILPRRLGSPAIQQTRDSHCQTINTGHGRIDIRECWVLSDPVCLGILEGWEDWSGSQTAMCADAQRQVGYQITPEEGYYISSLPNETSHTNTAPALTHE